MPFDLGGYGSFYEQLRNPQLPTAAFRRTSPSTYAPITEADQYLPGYTGTGLAPRAFIPGSGGGIFGSGQAATLDPSTGSYVIKNLIEDTLGPGPRGGALSAIDQFTFSPITGQPGQFSMSAPQNSFVSEVFPKPKRFIDEFGSNLAPSIALALLGANVTGLVGAAGAGAGGSFGPTGAGEIGLAGGTAASTSGTASIPLAARLGGSAASSLGTALSADPGATASPGTFGATIPEVVPRFGISLSALGRSISSNPLAFLQGANTAVGAAETSLNLLRRQPGFAPPLPSEAAPEAALGASALAAPIPPGVVPPLPAQTPVTQGRTGNIRQTLADLSASGLSGASPFFIASLLGWDPSSGIDPQQFVEQMRRQVNV